MKIVVARDNVIVGTYDDGTLRALLSGGTLKLADQYWHPVRAEWRPVMDFLDREHSPAASIAAGRVASFGRVMALVVAVSCGAALMWWWQFELEQKRSKRISAALQIETKPQASPPPDSRPAPAPAKPPVKSGTVEIVSVESYEDEVAVTLHNTGEVPVDGIGARLTYHEMADEKKIVRTSDVRIDVRIEPGLVRRAIVKRERNDKLGVKVTLAEKRR